MPEAIQDCVGQAGPADRRAQPQLVAAGQEDARRIADGRHEGLVVGLAAGHRVNGLEALDAELSEDLTVSLTRFRAQRAGGADDHDPGGRAAGERHEPTEDDPVPDLVLRAADHDDGPVGHG